MLEVTHLARSYPSGDRELSVLSDVSLSLKTGDSAAIMGPSGCGKTTLLNIVGTLDSPTRGKVVINKQEPFALSGAELARFRNRSIGFVFQEHHLLPQCTVLENVLLPALVNTDNNGAESRACDLIERVGVVGRMNHRPAELSGGERQRVALARALVNKPLLLLADEPTGNLDQKTAASIADLLMELQQAEDLALLLVTHSASLATRCASVYSLTEGRLVSRGASPVQAT